MTAILTKSHTSTTSGSSEHIDTMPEIGDMVGHVPVAELRPRVEELPAFLEGCCSRTWRRPSRPSTPSWSGCSRTATRWRRCAASTTRSARWWPSLGDMLKKFDDGCHHTGDCVTLRRIVFRLYAMLKAHLAEEELYLAIIEHGESDDDAAKLAAAMEHAGITAF